jgi:hypothetical protein
MKTQRASRVIVFQSPLSPNLLLYCFFPEQKKGKVGFFLHLRLLRTNTAAAMSITTTAAPIAMYVVVGSALVGGLTA